MKGRIIVSTLLALLLFVSLPMSALAATWDIGNGDIIVNAGSGGQTVTQGSQVDVPDSAPVITGSSTENTVTINAEKDQTANVTLSGVNIDVRDKGKAAVSTTGEGNVSIELNGESTLRSGYEHAGLEKNNGGSLTIADEDKNGKLTAEGGKYGAGIGGGNKGNGDNIAISGGEVTAKGGEYGAGIGGGQSSNGSGITISGDAQVKAQGGVEYRGLKEGAAIGNGGTDTQKGDELDMDQVASGLSVDGFIQTYKPGDNMDTDTPEKTTIGKTGDHSWDKGTVTTKPTCTTEGVMTYTCTNTAHTSPITKTEPIPALNHDFKTYNYDNNATCDADGTETAKCERCDEKKTRTKTGSKLGHLFETYVYNNDATQDADGTETAHCAHPGCTVTDTRTAQGTKLPGDTAETAAENQAAPYWVSGPDGQSLPYQAQIKDGVLTVTVQADTASLRGSTGSLGQLEAQGITEIRFITNGAESAFTLSALLTSGTGTFTLTHEGKTVTFTLAEKDISGILK